MANTKEITDLQDAILYYENELNYYLPQLNQLARLKGFPEQPIYYVDSITVRRTNPLDDLPLAEITVCNERPNNFPEVMFSFLDTECYLGKLEKEIQALEDQQKAEQKQQEIEKKNRYENYLKLKAEFE